MILQIWIFENWGGNPKKVGEKDLFTLVGQKKNPMGSYGLGNNLRVDFKKPMNLMLLAFVWTEVNLKSFEHDLLDLEPRIIL